MYVVKINNMKFHSYIGVYEEEKKIGQNIEIDLRVAMNVDVLQDDIENTLSYSIFYKKIAAIVAESRVDLVETLALDIIQAIKVVDTERIGKVKVNIRKLAVPINGVFDSVEIEMEG